MEAEVGACHVTDQAKAETLLRVVAGEEGGARSLIETLHPAPEIQLEGADAEVHIVALRC
jgi:hypothetical protein